jgi:uncharacterized protein YPO0396
MTTTLKMETNRLIEFEGSGVLNGFRLHRLEVCNWGTFHGKVHVLRLDGQTSLLTGPNGSGKSTLVDALLTLMVPRNSGRNYNMASGAAKKTERSESTYIQGVWAEGLAGDTDVVEPKKLRPLAGTPSILLAVFHNACTCEWVTIGQVLWMTGEAPDHVYLVTSDNRSIVKDFRELGDHKKIERTLQARGLDVFKRFPAYAETFCKRMHLKYPDALNLFNTVVAIKETGEIGEFIRRHMLVRFDKADTLIEEADRHLDDLETCKRDIDTAQRQIELLQPVKEKSEALDAARTAARDVQAVRDGLRYYLAHVFTKQGAARVGKIEEELTTNAAAKEAAKLKKEGAEKDRDDAVAALAGLPEAAQLERLDAQEREANKAAQTRKSGRLRYDGLLKQAGLAEPVTNEAQFKSMRSRIDQRLHTTRGNFEEAIRQEAEHRRQAEVKRAEGQEKEKEIKQVEKSRSRIRGDVAGIRDRVCRETGIPASSLPFAGELIEVKAEHADWRQTLELLLGGFGRSMVVEEKHYRDVVRFLHRNTLNGKLDFIRVASAAPSLAEQKAGDVGRVFSLLNIRPDHPLRGCIAEEIRERYRHVCCADETEFNANQYAITKANLIRSGARGTKDDRRKTIDPENFVLGWDNHELLRTMANRALSLTEEARRLESLAEEAKKHKGRLDSLIQTLNTLLMVERYETISAGDSLETLRSIEEQRRKILAGNSKISDLEQKKSDASGKVAEADQALIDLGVGEHALQDEKRQVERTIERRRPDLIMTPTDFDVDGMAEKVRKYLPKGRSIALKEADAIENDIRTAVDGDLTRKSRGVDAAAEQLRDAMMAFLREFQNLQTDLSAKEDKVGDFLGLMAFLDQEKLPEAKGRFVRLMNNNIQKNIGLLDEMLRQSVDEYRMVLKGLSASLREIEYNRGTYIRINGMPTRSGLVMQFQRDLKDCKISATDPSPSDEKINKAFDAIRALLNRLRSDDRWRRTVTDTRNWLDFRVDEVTYEQPEQVFPHSSSDSRSGGQKAKLAFTVMAAAVAYQYGLLREEADARSFRFVVIDEIFGKTDETNSIYALKLFKKFQLQLLVVCPFTAQARVVDDFVSSYHLTSNPDWNNSQLISATLQEIEEARASELAS